jgi:DNA-binding transcriptional ArsR family regulator
LENSTVAAVSRRARDAFEALGDPTRRSLFERLAAGPMAVGDLAAGAAVSRPAVSQHLKVLEEAQLVTKTAVGARHIYRIDPRGIGAVRDKLDAWHGTAMAAFQAFADAEHEKDEVLK